MARTQKDLVSPPITPAQSLYLLLICSLPIVWPLKIKLHDLGVQLADFIFLGIAVTWLISLMRGRAQLRRSWFYVPLGLYLLALLICAAFASTDPRLGALKLLGKVYLIGLAVLSFNLITSLVFLRHVFKAWQIGTVITVVVSLLGIILFYAGFRDPGMNRMLHLTYGSLPPGNYPRIQGLFEYPAMLANYLSISLMISLALWSAGWLQGHWFWPLIFGILITATFTFTPGMGGIALSLGLWLWLQLKSRGYHNASRSVLVGGIAVALVFFTAASIALFSHTSEGVDIPLARMQIEPSPRALTWQTAFETFKQHPLFGRGIGSEVSSVVYTDPSGNTSHLTDAHNTYLSVAAETGLIGLFTFSTVIFFLVKAIHSPDVNGPIVVLIGTCLGLAFLDAFLYQSFIGSFEDSRHLWVLFGILAAHKEGLSESIGSSLALSD